MTPLIELVIRYGKAVEDSCDPSKSYALRIANCDLASDLLKLIRERIEMTGP